jgi:hypothetical protein
MPGSLSETYNEVGDKLKSVQTYKEVSGNYNEQRKKVGEQFRKGKESTTELLDSVASQPKRFLRNTENQLDKLFDLLKQQGSTGNGVGGTAIDTTRFLRGKFTESVNRLQPEVEKIVLTEIKKLLGCSQEIKYTPQSVYIPISSIDLFGILKNVPDNGVGSLQYETTESVPGDIPYSVNRELSKLIFNNVPYSTTYGTDYLGYSGQKLFNIEYISSGTYAEHYKVTFTNKLNGDNLVSEFIDDYYKTISLYDFRNFWSNVFENILGVESIQSGQGSQDVEDENYFLIIIQRIFGLCFDDRQEIDVAGTSKVPELDGVDEKFFELNEVDLRNITQRINNIQQGVVEYPDCTTVKLPVNVQATFNDLVGVDDNMQPDSVDQLIDDIVNKTTNNQNWPQLPSLKLKINEEVIKQIPLALIKTLLSPKVLLGIMALLKNLGQNIVDQIDGIKGFLLNFKSLIINITSKIFGVFIKILYELIISDLKRLLRTIIQDIGRNKVLKKYRVIFSLIDIAKNIARIVDDYRKCRSVIDVILNAIQLALKGPGSVGISIPAPILALADARPGFDNGRALINIVEEFQKIGIPTEALPDGSPNQYLLSKFAEISAVEKEREENSVTKTLLTAVDIAIISQTGFVTKSGLVL